MADEQCGAKPTGMVRIKYTNRWFKPDADVVCNKPTGHDADKVTTSHEHSADGKFDRYQAKNIVWMEAHDRVATDNTRQSKFFKENDRSFDAGDGVENR